MCFEVANFEELGQILLDSKPIILIGVTYEDAIDGKTGIVFFKTYTVNEILPDKGKSKEVLFWEIN